MEIYGNIVAGFQMHAAMSPTTHTGEIRYTFWGQE
jgi:hypothetical protein